ncbi:hypothetical protein K438DRAFT_2079618 [Mycena galopus ATCC 62051]|nr:hypothetical protein K438DRAFT_2079618 [Mycena galopus ATCC 62051]
MNENRAPLTIVPDTLDDAARMVPGFAYLSSDTTTPTQVTFLQEVKRLVEQMARDLVEVVEGLKDHANTVMEQAHLICRHGWKPAFFMIDKLVLYRLSDFLSQVSLVFPGVTIRICQFHVMQAILHWERDSGTPGEQQSRPALDLCRKHQLLWAVREIQRCRNPAQWQTYLDQFRQRLDYITVWEYFSANWFLSELWTDMGFPAGRNRDNMLSTNNWTERAFKTFNQVFLGNRNNKSIYCLVLILANEWFQYYQAWKPRKQFDQKVFKINTEGHRLWSCEGAVQQFVMDNGRTAWCVASTN